MIKLIKKFYANSNLASGRGKRTRHNLPKPLIDIGNTCLFDQNKEFYKNFRHKILTVGYKKEKFLSKIDKSYILIENKIQIH